MLAPNPRHPAPTSVARNLRHALAIWGVPLLVALGATPVVVRGLGAGAYGVYALALGLGGQVLGLGLGRGLARHVAAAHAHDDRARTSALVSTALRLSGCLALPGALALAAGSEWLSRSLNLDAVLQPQARDALLLTALAFPVAAWTHLLAVIPQALQRYELSSRVAAALAAGVGLANVVLASRGHGVVALLAANLAATALAGLALLLLARRLLPGVRFGARADAGALRDLLHFSGAVFTHEACGTLLLLWERVYLTRALGAEALTHYVVPMSLALHFHAGVASLTGLLVPLSAAALARADGRRLRALYERAARFALALAAFFVAGTLAGGQAFLAAWMGAAFAERAAPVLALHALTFGLLALGTVSWHFAEALGRPGWNAAFAGAWLLLAAPLMPALAPTWDLQGVAAARLLGLVCLLGLVARVERAVFGAVRARQWAGLLLRLAAPSLATYVLVRALVAVAPGVPGLLLATLLAPVAFVAGVWFGGYLPLDDRAWLWRQAAGLRSGGRGSAG